MSSLRVSGNIGQNLTNENQMNYHNVRNQLQVLEKQYDFINEQITTNLKIFDEIVAQDKETYDKIKRNLQDIKTIFVKDLDKFQENVDQSIQYNQSLYARLEKDAHYLRDDQEKLRRKMIQMEKRINQMNQQIGESF